MSPEALERRLQAMGWRYLHELRDMVRVAQLEAAKDTIAAILLGLKSENDTPQLRAIIASVESLTAEEVLRRGTEE